MRVRHTISGVVLSVDIPADAKSIHHPSRAWNEWDDRTTPRTDKPVRFVWAGKFVHHGALGYVTSCELA